MLKIDTHAHYLPRDWRTSRRNTATSVSGDPPRRRRPFPHLQGRQVLPRDLAEDLGPEDAHRRVRRLRRAGAGISTVPVMFSYWAKPQHALRPASGAERPHGETCATIRAITPGSAPCRAIATTAIQELERLWTNSACRACRSVRTSTATGTWTRRAVRFLPGGERPRRGDPDASVGHDGQRIDAEILAAVAGRHAGEQSRAACCPSSAACWNDCRLKLRACPHGGGSFHTSAASSTASTCGRTWSPPTTSATRANTWSRLYFRFLVADDAALRYLHRHLRRRTVMLGTDYPSRWANRCRAHRTPCAGRCRRPPLPRHRIGMGFGLPASRFA